MAKIVGRCPLLSRIGKDRINNAKSKHHDIKMRAPLVGRIVQGCSLVQPFEAAIGLLSRIGAKIGHA